MKTISPELIYVWKVEYKDMPAVFQEDKPDQDEWELGEDGAYAGAIRWVGPIVMSREEFEAIPEFEG